MIESQKQLRETTEIANDSIRLKNVFLASMTHELRTPLNAIVGFATVLKATDEPEERKELIDIINSSCDMLQRLINDILEASSITKNLPSTIQPSHIDFVHEFENLCFMVEYRIKQAGLEFIRENPYENFYTTKPVGEGTGLGMAITHDIIVNRLHGKIQIDSIEGEYACFTLIIPAKIK